MTKQETITISKYKYDMLMRYINEGSIPIEEHIKLMEEHITALERITNQLIDSIETNENYSECLTSLNENLDKEITDTDRKLNNFRGCGFSKYAGKIKFGVDSKFKPITTVTFRLKDDIDFGDAIIEIADIIERFGEK